MGVAVRGTTAYVADDVHNVIRAVDTVTGHEWVVAGTGGFGYYGDGGPATKAGLSGPTAVAVDAGGNVYIIDEGNRLIRKVAPDGTIYTIAGGGAPGTVGDGGPATAADLHIYGLAVDGDGNVLASEQYTIRKIDPSGTITTVAVTGLPWLTANLSAPEGLSVDSSGGILVAEYVGQRVRRIDPTGASTLVTRRMPDGSLSSDFDHPYSVEPTPDGSVLVVAAAQVILVRPDLSWTVVAGGGTGAAYSGDGGPATAASLWSPRDLAVDSDGNVFIADLVVRRVGTDGIISTLAGSGFDFTGDNVAAVNAELSSPEDVAAAPDGSVYIADRSSERLRKVDTSGLMTTVAGGGSTGDALDGLSGTAAAVEPHDVVATAAGVYFSNGDSQVYRLDPAGVLHLVAGRGASNGCRLDTDCARGDGGPATAAQLNQSRGLAVDAAGNLYIADSQNSRIRKVTPSGIISTIAGGHGYGFSGDRGPASQAQLSAPMSVAADRWGNIYLTDTFNFRVRKIDTAGIITTVVGDGQSGFVGDGAPARGARLVWPQAVDVDGQGNLFITDANRVRKVDVAGCITTLVGTGDRAFWGDGGAPGAAALSGDGGMSIDASGALFIADIGNRRVRRVTGVAAGAGATAAGWGWNPFGQVGGGTVSDSVAPTAAGGPDGFTEVAAGGYHTVGRRADGTVWSWGWNGFGQLGDGTGVERHSPVAVASTQLKGAVSVVAGLYHSLALRSDGTVWAWGWNGGGQLGTGNTVDARTPTQVIGLTDVVAISAGALHSLALKADGSVWAWGWNGYGQLGSGATVTSAVPVPVAGLPAVKAIAGGFHHSLAVGADGAVYAWGWNVLGQLGDGTTVDRHVPVAVAGVSNVQAVAGGVLHTVALGDDGHLWSWGWNGLGQLGTGASDSATPVAVASGSNRFTTLSAGTWHSLAVDVAGKSWAWGWNAYGQLGDGTKVDRRVPAQTQGAQRVVGVSGGVLHSLQVVSG